MALSGRWLMLVVVVYLLLLDINTVSARRRRSKAAARSAGPARCEHIQVPMCKNQVSYNTTKLPNQFGHTTQAQVYWAMQPWWPFIDAGCSDNLRAFICGLYLPKCVGEESPPHYPCVETCRKAKSRCKRPMRRQGVRWNKHFRCKRLLKRTSNKCIKPLRETKKGRNREYVLCEVNKLSMCQNIPFSQGSLPNMFLQTNLETIEREMVQYRELVSSGCSPKLRLFLCGVFMPFCVQGRSGGTSGHITPQHDVPFLLPCREWCQEVHDQCSGEYEQRTHGLPWPGKFHCHRFPSYTDQYGHGHNASVPGIPCTMPPVDLSIN